MMREFQTPKVSVIMANYNNEKYLPESINSILNQTYKNIELIIIDDCSSDDSKEIINNYSEIDNRVISLFNDRNMGPAFARNRGLEVAKSKYIAILDSDDIALRYRIEKQVNFLENNPYIFLVGGTVVIINENGDELNRVYCITKPSLLAKRLAVTTTHTLYHSAVMFRNTREFFYREKIKYSHDYDLYLRMISSGKKLANLNKFVIKKRESHTSIASIKTNEQLIFCKLSNEYYHQRITKGVDDYDSLNENSILTSSTLSWNECGINTLLPRSPNRWRRILILFYDKKLRECRKEIITYLEENQCMDFVSKLKLVIFLIASYFSVSIYFFKIVKIIKNKII
jgi:glycosyltransferase involved in cell wall biosynthesis